MAGKFETLDVTSLTPALIAEMKPEDIGLMPYEARFVAGAYELAEIRKHHHKDAFAEAVDNSGGDWALDDPAVQSAAEAAHIDDLERSELAGLLMLPEIEYPNPELTIVTFGSRITVQEGRIEEVFDIPTHKILSLNPESGVEFISPYSPYGRAVLLAEVGQTVEVPTPTGSVLSVLITSIDQTSQRDYFEAHIPAPQPEAEHTEE